MNIDVVIPYVNNQDVEWQREYEKYNIKSDNDSNSINRYRDYGTLKYIFRGIETHMSWIRYIFLILSGPTQIPEWLDTSNPKLKIIYHSDYIPQEYLPTFNSNTIECFLWRIPELSEHFIYINDDMFLIRDLSISDFFTNDYKCKVNIYKHKIKSDNYLYSMWNNNYKFGLINHPEQYDENVWIGSDHGYNPKIKSHAEQLFDYWGSTILYRFTPTRNRKNVTQWMFDIYEWDLDNAEKSNIKVKLAKADSDLFQYKDYDIVVLNDQEYFDFDSVKNNQNTFLGIMLPIPSSFEKLSDDKLVSCIIPTYNGADRIIKTLDTIKSQSYKNFECLIIDDGSTDNTKQVVEEYCKTDKRFKYFHKENGGVSSARNYGMSLAKGDYVCFSDDDDINCEHKFLSSVDYLNNHDESFVFTQIYKFKNNKKISEYHNFGYFNLQTAVGCKLSTVANLVLKRLSIKEFSDTVLAEDLLFNIDLIAKWKIIPVLNYVGYLYIVRSNSAITTVQTKGLSEENQIKLANEIKTILTKYKSETKEIKSYIVSALNSHIKYWSDYFSDRFVYETMKTNVLSYVRVVDVVITYVNGNDPEFVTQISKYTDSYSKNRYYDYGTLKYLFRLIEKNMKFVNKIHLVISSESQVPNWVNRDVVNVVTHDMIIPKEFLPTFNSCTIEMFLQNIPNLSEKYIYFNDDMFPMKELTEIQFFSKDGVLLKTEKHNIADTMFKKQCKQSTLLANPNNDTFYTFGHTVSPMLKSLNVEFFNEHREDIEKTITIFRTAGNLNQYVYLNNLIYKNKISPAKISSLYFNITVDIIDTIRLALLSCPKEFICLNDGMKSDNITIKSVLIKTFEKIVPEKSIYEI